MLFDKKNKNEVESEPKYPTRESRTGLYVLNEKDEVVLREKVTTETFNPLLQGWIKSNVRTEDKTLASMGWVKSIQDFLVIKKLIPSQTQLKGFEAIFFLQKIEYRIREELEYLYLLREKASRKIYLKDFMTSICYPCPKNTNEYVLVKIVGEKPVSKAEVLKMYSEGKIGEVYDDVEEVEGEKVYKKRLYVK